MLCAVPSAWAKWGARWSMGTTVVLSDPLCASPSTGVSICAARGMGQTLMVNRFSGNHWSGWTMVAGLVRSNPSWAADGAGDVLCAARSGSGAISRRSTTAQPGALSSKPAAKSPRPRALLYSRWGMCSAWAAVPLADSPLAFTSKQISGASTRCCCALVGDQFSVGVTVVTPEFQIVGFTR